MPSGIYLRRLRPRLAATEKATSNDFRWAAGFYEGEGCARQVRGCTVTQITQKDPWVLERMKALFGGSIGPTGASRTAWQWHISGARARGFLMSIYGLLSPRRQQQIRNALGQ